MIMKAVRSVPGKGLILSLSLLAASAEARWPASVRATVLAYSNPFPDPHVATVWGGARADSLKLVNIPNANKVRFQTERFAKGSLETILSLRQSKDGRVIRAPLLVYLPGIFSELEGGQSLRGLSLFTERGFHVLVIPSPWALSYIEGRPENLPGHVEAEATIILEIIAQARQRYSELGYFDSIHLAGSSYGGFLSSVVVAKDAEGQKLINGQTTIFGPPLRLGHGMARLDALMDAEAVTFRGISEADMAILYLNIAIAKKQGDVFPAAIRKAPCLLAFGGFQSELVKSVELMDRLYQFPLVPSRQEANYNSWKFGLRFRDYVRDVAPSVADVMSGADNLLVWLGRAEKAGNPRYRVMTAADDLLNLSTSWPTDDPERIIVLPTGGHLGYMALPWFKKFLNAAYAEDLLNVTLMSEEENFE
jgi:hypothetical protein